jgi:hypothetical protein
VSGLTSRSGKITAYCPPGKKREARAVLLLHDNEPYDELVEHPWLDDPTIVLVAHPAALRVEWSGSVISRDAFDIVARSWQRAWDRTW